jgi:hypothetical protein
VSITLPTAVIRTPEVTVEEKDLRALEAAFRLGGLNALDEAIRGLSFTMFTFHQVRRQVLSRVVQVTWDKEDYL